MVNYLYYYPVANSNKKTVETLDNDFLDKCLLAHRQTKERLNMKEKSNSSLNTVIKFPY